MATIHRQCPGEATTGLDLPDQYTYTRTLYGGEVETCDFCGEPRATALWRYAHGLLSVCRPCTVDALASLTADALVGEQGHLPDSLARVRGWLTQFERRFWECAAGAFYRCGQAAQRRQREAHRKPEDN
jgi:hypothetical protein